MKKIYPFIFTFLAIFCFSAHAAQEQKATPLNKICQGLGEYCKQYLTECSKSENPVACLKLTRFELIVAAERCGDSSKGECFNKNNTYKARWMNELNIPNIANPKRPQVIKTCLALSEYDVESEELKGLESELVQHYPAFRKPIYHDYEKLYGCFSEKIR